MGRKEHLAPTKLIKDVGRGQVPNLDAKPRLTLKLVYAGIRIQRGKPATYGIFGDPGR
jgi:hypothetical protein